MTRRLKVRPPCILRWSGESLKCLCGSVTAHVAVYIRSIKSPVMELERVSVVRLSKVMSFSVLVVNGDVFHPGSAWTDASTASTCAADTIGYPIHFVKKKNSLPDSIHYLLGIKSRFLKPPSTSQDDLQAVVDAVCYESLAVKEDGTKASAVLPSSD